MANPRHLRSFPLLCLLACLLTMPLLEGCFRKKPYVAPVRIPRKVAVVDFSIDPTLRTDLKTLEGWWFGSRSVYRNENVGRNVADEVAKTLRGLPYIDLASRLDYRYYIEGKRQLLEVAFEEVEDIKYETQDYDRMIETIDPIEIGRELGVDLVVAGHVDNAYMAHNRTVEWIWSGVEIRVDVLNVRTGQREGSFAIEAERSLSSPLRLIRQELRKKLPNLDQLIGNAPLN
jgi:hypothetical protein